MTEALIIEIMYMVLQMIGLLSGPIVGTAIVVGILINVVQTVTQIKDQTLAFVPKVAITGIVLLLLVPWYIQIIRQFTHTIFKLMETATL